MCDSSYRHVFTNKMEISVNLDRRSQLIWIYTDFKMGHIRVWYGKGETLKYQSVQKLSALSSIEKF